VCNTRGKVRNVTSAQLSSEISKKGAVWVDVLNPSREDLDFLEESLGIHGLALENCLEETPHPKFEPYGGHFFMTTQELHYNKGALIFNELDMILGPGLVISSLSGLWPRLV